MVDSCRAGFRLSGARRASGRSKGDPLAPVTDKKSHTSPVSSAGEWGVSPAVLVVDDEPAIRDLLCESLLQEGFHCEGASNGQEALDQLHRRQYALVLSDIDMPSMDGVRLLQGIKE